MKFLVISPTRRAMTLPTLPPVKPPLTEAIKFQNSNNGRVEEKGVIKVNAKNTEINSIQRNASRIDGN